MKEIAILLFEDFTALDVFGPVEVLGSLEDCHIAYVSQKGGVVCNHQGIRILTEHWEQDRNYHACLVPGGWGTRKLVGDAAGLQWVAEMAASAEWCLSVCTGAALLARAGLLDGRRATTNKRSMDWVASQGEAVTWIRDARWVKDGKYYTAAGVSAGIDMALAFVSDRYGRDKAQAIAQRMEYRWAEQSSGQPL